ncbi:MAG: AAA family ATPase, partial [Clostridia bacterium]|nr:AAA family ATPase [Clostridia bacterium]
MIQRKEYLNNLIALKDKQVIKVITGVRRCGKSTLFELYIDHLKQTGVEDSQIISVNLEDLENADLLNYKTLYDYITSRLVPDKSN